MGDCRFLPILSALKAKGLAPDVPEALSNLIKQAVSIHKYIEMNEKDKDSKNRLINLMSIRSNTTKIGE